MTKPDEIVEEMKRLDERLVAEHDAGRTTGSTQEEWEECSYGYIPHSLKLIAEQAQEIERLKGRPTGPVLCNRHMTEIMRCEEC